MVWVPRAKIIYFQQAADHENTPSREDIDEALCVLNRAFGDILLVSGFRGLGEYPSNCLHWAGEAAWEYVRERSWYGPWALALGPGPWALGPGPGPWAWGPGCAKAYFSFP